MATDRSVARGAAPLCSAVVLLAAVSGCDLLAGVLRSGTGTVSARSGASAADLDRDALRPVADDLDTPWAIRFLPDGDLLVTERGGDLVRIRPAVPAAHAGAAAEGTSAGGSGRDIDASSAAGRVLERHEIPGVREVGEAGLMGLALHPGYPSTPWIYVCHTGDAGGDLENRVVRFRYSDGRLSGRTTLLTGMAGAPVHDGCRLEFGPDGHLFVTMGDAGSGARAQDREALNGKILRIADGGGVPPDNPFGTAVWSWGHRNPQGLARDARGRLWSTEHGPSGLASGRDELNLIRKGANYGWPEVTGDETRDGMAAPLLHSGPDTWAPAGLAHLDGRLFFGGLRGEALYEVRGPGSVRWGSAGPPGHPAGEAAAGDGGAPSLRLMRHLAGELGRLRAVRAGPDGRLYFGTSNRDGRGDPREDDDRIFSVDPEALTGG